MTWLLRETGHYLQAAIDQEPARQAEAEAQRIQTGQKQRSSGAIKSDSHICKWGARD